MLLSWDEPLHHVVTELQGIKDASPDLLSKAAEIEEKTKVLLEGAEQIQTKVTHLLKASCFFPNERDDLVLRNEF